MTHDDQQQALDVTVIIPTRDCLPYLPAAIRSATTQRVENMEVIVVDDGSRDETWSWLQAQSAFDPRIRGIRLDGVGVSAARNVAIRAARGELIAFLDADDTWEPGKLKQQIAFHNANPRVLLSFTDYQHVAMDGRDLGNCFDYWPRVHQLARDHSVGFSVLHNGLAALYAENVVGTSSVVARRDALLCVSGFDEHLHSASDWDLWLKLASRGPVGFSIDVLMTYLVRPGSISRKALLRLETMRKIMDRYRGRVAQEAPSAVAVAEARLQIGYGEYHRGDGRYDLALNHDLRALQLAPSLRAGKAVMSDAWRLTKQTFSHRARSVA